MSRQPRPLAGVVVQDVPTQRKLAQALARHEQLVAVQALLQSNTAAALTHAGFIPQEESGVTLEIQASGLNRCSALAFSEPVHGLSLQLCCRLHVRFQGPTAGQTRLSIGLFRQADESGTHSFDEVVLAHQSLAVTPAEATGLTSRSADAVLAHWKKLRLAEPEGWCSKGLPAFVAEAVQWLAP
jgi:hypothetical protein